MNDQFAEAISDFLQRIEREHLSEDQVSSLMSGLKVFAPHSHLSDIIFYGERERTAKEIVQEAELREFLWAEGGEEAVTGHVEALMRAALSDPATRTTHRYSAMSILEGIERNTGRRRPT